MTEIWIPGHPSNTRSPNHHTHHESPPEYFVDIKLPLNDSKMLQTVPCEPLWPQTSSAPNCIFASFWPSYAPHPISPQCAPTLLLCSDNCFLTCFLPAHVQSLHTPHVHVTNTLYASHAFPPISTCLRSHGISRRTCILTSHDVCAL